MDKFSAWLSNQDSSIRYIYKRFVEQEMDDAMQRRVASEGYGCYLLSQQNPDGHWGKYYYQPKWTSTHYTLLQLKDLGISPSYFRCREIVFKMFEECQLDEGGLNLAKANIASDVCVDGMILNYASYFIPEFEGVEKLVRSIRKKQKRDGGFTWLDQSEGDPHSTICVLEGLHVFRANTSNIDLRLEVEETIQKALGYFYQHDLFIEENSYRKLAYPFRYFYSVFRFLLLAAELDLEINESIDQALQFINKKEQKGFFHLEKEYRGQTFLEFSKIGEINPFLTVYGKYIYDKWKCSGES